MRAIWRKYRELLPSNGRLADEAIASADRALDLAESLAGQRLAAEVERDLAVGAEADHAALIKERDELRALVDAALDVLARSPYFNGRRPADLVAAVDGLKDAYPS